MSDIFLFASLVALEISVILLALGQIEIKNWINKQK
jgi:hypothetical protein